MNLWLENFNRVHQLVHPGGKSLVVLAVERVLNKEGKQTLGRPYAKTIDNASAESLKIILQKHIADDASIKADGWRGYLPLKKEWNLDQILSNKGENFKLLHTHIINIKGWLRGHSSQMFSKKITRLFE